MKEPRTYHCPVCNTELHVIGEELTGKKLYYCWDCDDIRVTIFTEHGTLVLRLANGLQGVYKTSLAGSIRKVHEKCAYTTLW